MLLLAADENFNNDILRGIRRRKPVLDIVRVQDAGLLSADEKECPGRKGRGAWMMVCKWKCEIGDAPIE